MLLASALFALFLGGLWLYCLTDAILTPVSECRGMPKPAWIAVIAATFIGGAVAWLIVRQPLRNAPPRLAPLPCLNADDGPEDDSYPGGQRWTDADEAVARHPAGRARGAASSAAPMGPDDDDDFLRALDRVIRNTYEPDEETP
jgi:peptidoglycan/LPS O-acetylase OafA/YrhL